MISLEIIVLKVCEGEYMNINSPPQYELTAQEMLTTAFLIEIQTCFILSHRDEGIVVQEIDGKTEDADASIFHA